MLFMIRCENSWASIIRGPIDIRGQNQTYTSDGFQIDSRDKFWGQIRKHLAQNRVKMCTNC